MVVDYAEKSLDNKTKNNEIDLWIKSRRMLTRKQNFDLVSSQKSFEKKIIPEINKTAKLNGVLL